MGRSSVGVFVFKESGLVRLLIPARKDDTLYHPRDPTKSSQRNNPELSDLQLQQGGIDVIVSHIHQQQAVYKCLKLLMSKMLEASTPGTSAHIDIDKVVSDAMKINLFSSADNYRDQDEVNRRKALDGLLDPISEKLSPENGFKQLFQYFVNFVKSRRGEQAKELVSDSGIGLVLFCCLNGEIDFLVIDQEFDCRGEVDQVNFGNDSVTFTILAG
mmetsp:Transcript_21033/g.35627  ORF Transcript_21033/g.35627 Transcript_21033/m.35627 type:complete len:215 (-) Transcript_21033:500-1144(-)